MTVCWWLECPALGICWWESSQPPRWSLTNYKLVQQIIKSEEDVCTWKSCTSTRIQGWNSALFSVCFAEKIKLRDPSDTKNIPESTFVVTQGEVKVAGDGCSQGEEEAVSTQRLVFIHCADGLDHLREAAATWRSVSVLLQGLFIHVITENVAKLNHCCQSDCTCASPLRDLYAGNGRIHLS